MQFMKGTVVKRNGKDLLVKSGCVGFNTLGGMTNPLDPGLLTDSTAYMELTDI